MQLKTSIVTLFLQTAFMKWTFQDKIIFARQLAGNKSRLPSRESKRRIQAPTLRNYPRDEGVQWQNIFYHFFNLASNCNRLKIQFRNAIKKTNNIEIIFVNNSFFKLKYNLS